MKVHYADNYIINPQHRVTVDLVGAGGTGSQMLQSLARIDYALYKLGHPGLSVRVYDNDIVTEANVGRQLFSPNDVGLYKSDVLVTRINAFYGLDWKSEARIYDGKDMKPSNITISCVDNVASRIRIGNYLRDKKTNSGGYDMHRKYYWLDFGNQTDRGQVVLGSIGEIKQPKKSKYETVPHLKTVDELFDLKRLKEQDLFINSALCQLGSALLWKLFSEGCVSANGAYLNLSTMTSVPMKL